MSLDDIMTIGGRLLTAIVLIGAAYLGLKTYAPGWFDNTINAGLSTVSSYIPLP